MRTCSRNKVGLALPSRHSSTPHLQHRQGLWGAGEQQLFGPCTAGLLLLHWDVTWQRKSPNPSSSKTRTESKLPLPHHTEGAISHNNHWPTLPFSSLLFLFLLYSLCKNNSSFHIFSGQHFGTHCLQQTQPHQFSAYLVASKQGAARGWEYKCIYKPGALQAALPLLQAMDITWNCLPTEPKPCVCALLTWVRAGEAQFSTLVKGPQ